MRLGKGLVCTQQPSGDVQHQGLRASTGFCLLSGGQGGTDPALPCCEGNTESPEQVWGCLSSESHLQSLNRVQLWDLRVSPKQQMGPGQILLPCPGLALRLLAEVWEDFGVLELATQLLPPG